MSSHILPSLRGAGSQPRHGKNLGCSKIPYSLLPKRDGWLNQPTTYQPKPHRPNINNNSSHQARSRNTDPSVQSNTHNSLTCSLLSTHLSQLTMSCSLTLKQRHKVQDVKCKAALTRIPRPTPTRQTSLQPPTSPVHTSLPLTQPHLLLPSHLNKAFSFRSMHLPVSPVHLTFPPTNTHTHHPTNTQR